MASKGKQKLSKKQFLVGVKVIDLERFAYDMFVHSAKKFGVDENCIDTWKGSENHYGLPNFIVVMSRFMIRGQILQRSLWYKEFMKYYVSTQFRSFDKIKSALQGTIYNTSRLDPSQIIHEAIISLSTMSELIIFLFTHNCELYLMDLSKYWRQYWGCQKKELVKAGGFESLYRIFNNEDETKMDVFFNEFIPVNCIPYRDEPTLEKNFMDEYERYLNLPPELVAERERQYQAGIRDVLSNIEQLLALAVRIDQTSERDEASGINVPRNTGLGIQTHEDLLRDVFGADAATSSQDLPSTSRQATERERRGSFSRKGGQKKKPGSRSSVGDDQRLKTGLLGAIAAASDEDLPSTSLQETVRDPRVASSQKEGQKKSSSRSSVEDLQRLKTSLLGAVDAASGEDLPSTSLQETERDPGVASSQKEGQKRKSSSRSIVQDLEQLNLDAPKKPSDEKKK